MRSTRSLLALLRVIVVLMDTPNLPAYPFRAPYSPAALRAFSHITDPSPTLQEIGQHRFATRQGVRRDGMEQLNRPRLLHDHFSLDTMDRKFAHHEGLMDIHDAVSIILSVLSGPHFSLFLRLQEWPGCPTPCSSGLLSTLSGTSKNRCTKTT